jgi:hypothetical protein
MHQPTGETTYTATRTKGSARNGSEIIADRPEEYREAAQLLIDACGEPPRGDRIPAQPVR